MLLMLEDYIREYPKREMQTIDKFKDCEKYLHEMTLEEINAAVAKWNPITPTTATKQKSQISVYLRWLNEKGIQTAISPQETRHIEMPLIDKNNYFIFSTAEMLQYYEDFFKVLERERVRGNDVPQNIAYYMCRAAGILSYYGLTKEQILALDLSDVQSDGVRGYDLPLTDDDIQALLDYKLLNAVGRGAPLLGTKYIRSTKSGEKFDGDYLSARLWRTKLNSKDRYFVTLLSVTNLYTQGVYDRLYRYEIEHNVFTDRFKNIPQWFTDIMGEASASALTIKRNQYLEYRKARNKAESVRQPVEQSMSKQEKEEINSKINDLAAQARAIFEEMDKLKKKLK